MKIVYITGCLGFMASYVTKKALDRGWFVRGVDKITYAANEELLNKYNQYPNFEFEQCDIKDLKRLYDCDYIINFKKTEEEVVESVIDWWKNRNIIEIQKKIHKIYLQYFSKENSFYYLMNSTNN